MARIAGNVCNTYIHIDLLVEEISVERYAKNSVLFNTINGVTFAGKGTDTEIRDRFRLESTYNIPADKWEKVSGKGKVVVEGKEIMAELHWYQADGEVFEMKVKRYLE